MAPKIHQIQICQLQPPPPSQESAKPWRDVHWDGIKQATPFDRFEEPLARREPGGLIWVKVVADDGTYGLGNTDTGLTATVLIRETLGPAVLGQEVGAIMACNDRMWHAAISFGMEGVTARAVAGIDLALWDLWGKAVDQPVYRLAGGPARQTMDVYLTGNDVDWGHHLGFRKFKLARPYGVYDGQAGIEGTVEYVAKKREIVGPKADLMLDCWMAYDVDYAVHMCEALRPLRLEWMEEMLKYYDWPGHQALRQRLPWQRLATGEHWSTRYPGMRAVDERLVDLIQADMRWIGGFTEAMKLAHHADAASLPMCLHTGANDLYGQHWTAAMPNTPLIEYIVFSKPGIPFESCYVGAPTEEGRRCYRSTPGQPVPKEGKIGLPPGPGFGLQVPEEWLVPIETVG